MNRQSLMELIKTAPTNQLLESTQVKDRFQMLYQVIHGIKEKARADAYYTAEKFHFLKLINDSKDLKECTKLSLYGVFMDMAVSGLSFDPSMKHVYLYSYNINVGTKDNPQWEKRATLNISPYGELLLRTLQGQIKYADNPVLVYEGDEFRYGTKNNMTILEHMATIPRKSDTIIACYVRLTRHDDSVDYKVFATEDVMKLKAFSKQPNSLAWTSGFPGMVQAKTIKHAFKTFPKLRVGEFSRLESDIVDTQIEPESQITDLYGFDADDASGAAGIQHALEQGAFTPAANFNQQQQEADPVATQPKQEQPAKAVELDF